MRTAKEMDEYSLSRGFSIGNKSALKHFQLIENQLKQDEYVRIAATVVGINNGNQAVMGGTTALAFTNKRFIYAQKGGFLFGEQIKIVNLDTVNDIHKEPFGISYGKISIDTLKENIGIEINKNKIDDLFNEIANIIDEYKKDILGNTIVQQVSSADELKKFKELLDTGIISEDEFELKKKQILGI